MDAERLPRVVGLREIPEGERKVVVEVGPRGGLSVDGVSLDMAAFTRLLGEKAAEGREEAPPRLSLVNVVLRVDRDLPWQAAQWLMQACAHPDIRLNRIHFGALPATGGVEGVLPAFLPSDPGIETDDFVEEGDEALGVKPRIHKATIQLLRVRLSLQKEGAPAAVRDLYPWLEGKFPDLRDSGFHGELDAAPDTPSGDVVATVDALLRAGMKSVLFRGTAIFRGESLDASLAEKPRETGVLRIEVNGTSIVE